MKVTLPAKWRQTEKLEGHSAGNIKHEGHATGKVECGGLKATLLTKWSMQGVILK